MLYINFRCKSIYSKPSIIYANFNNLFKYCWWDISRCYCHYQHHCQNKQKLAITLPGQNHTEIDSLLSLLVIINVYKAVTKF